MCVCLSTNVTLLKTKYMYEILMSLLICSYRLLGVTIFRPGHYRSLINVKGQWIDYNPARYGKNKVDTNNSNISRDELIQTVVYTKEDSEESTKC